MKTFSVRESVLIALAKSRHEPLTVSRVIESANEIAGCKTDPRNVLSVLRALERDGRVKNTSKNPQCTEWRYVSEGERLASKEEIELRASAKRSAERLRDAGISSATANRGAVRVSISARDADRLVDFIVALGLGSDNGFES